MVGNIGIGIANAIGFRRKNLGGGHISYPGLIAAWSAKGKTNDDADRNVLKDLTGNGHDITLNNFAYSGMSGYGGILSFTNNPLNCEKLASGKYKLLRTAENIYFSNLYTRSIHSTFKVKITGVESSGTVLYYSNNNDNITLATIKKDGIYTIPAITEISGWAGFTNKESLKDIDIVIEILPEYPDALVFDGVDDYGVNESIKDVLNGCEEYTVIAKRKLQNPDGRKCNFMITSTNYNHINTNFQLEYVNINNQHITYSGGCLNNVNFTDSITYQTPTSYNQQIIKDNGNRVCNGIVIGNNSTAGGMFIKCAFYSAYLFNRTLTDEEIKSFIRKHIDPEYLLPSEIVPTPDVYYDFTNGDNSKGEANKIIKDLSGNGNDAVAHNFAWNEESGYAEGGLKFDGVDDYVSLDAFNRGFKTVFSLFTPLKENGFLYDQRGNNFLDYNFAIATFNISDIAYSSRNKKGTYINNVFNTKLKVSDLLNKKHLVHVLTDSIETPPKKVHMGTNFNNDNDSYGKIVIYKFLGFKEALTEEQIKAVINKYNLLDGVDNIDVN